MARSGVWEYNAEFGLELDFHSARALAVKGCSSLTSKSVEIRESPAIRVDRVCNATREN
jgi:hypothetical protein